MTKLVGVTEKYRFYEAESIIRNSRDYLKKDIEKAKKFVIEYRKLYPVTELQPITEEMRSQIKKNNPNTYK